MLSSALTHIQISRSCLILNAKKLFISVEATCHYHAFSLRCFLGAVELEVVNEFKYLGVIIDSKLSFKNHVKMLSKKIKFHLYNFKQIRGSLSDASGRSMVYLKNTLE